MLLVRHGAVQLKQQGEQKIVLPRSAIHVPPDASRHITAGVGAELDQVAFRRSVLDPERLGGVADGLFGMLGPEVRVVHLSPAVFDEACALMRRIETEGGQRRSGRDVMQRLVLVELLMVVYRCFQSGEEAGNTGPARFRIEEAADYIGDRYAEELSLPEIASHFGFNPSYFSRLFAQQTGVHVFEYLNTVRIRKSCLLLKRTSMSIVEIAFAVGYNSLSHFNRYFRRIMEMSPREFRSRGEK